MVNSGVNSLPGVLPEECFDVAELIADVFELFVECFAVVGKPVLDALEQIPGEVVAVAL